MLPEEDQFLVLCEFIDQCTPQQKLRLQEKLKDHLTRDFVTLLPLEIVLQIFSYVSVDDLVVGLQVCRGWQMRISQATPVWKAAAKKIGLSDFIVSAKMPRYGSMMSLTKAALKHRNALSSCVAKMMAVPGDLNDDHEYRWAGNGVVYSSWHSRHAISVDVKVISDFHSQLSVSRTHYRPKKLTEYLVPAWATAVGIGVGKEYIIWRNRNHDSWVKCRLDDGEPNFQVWRDNTDLQPHLADVCDTCGLIATFPADVAMEGQSVISVTIRKLLCDQRRVEKTFCQLVVPKSLHELERSDSVVISEIDIDSGRRIVAGFCTFHCVLLRFQCGRKSGDCVIAKYHIPTYTTPATSNIDPIQVLQPRGDPNILSFFQRSADGKLVSMVETWTCRHHIWSMDTGIYCVIQGPPSSITCLALGHLYSVLQCENSVKVVSTFTGQVLLTCSAHLPKIISSFPDTTNLPYPRFWEPLDSKWLNDFDCYQKEQWHIVAVNTGLAGPTKLSSVVALQVNKS